MRDRRRASILVTLAALWALLMAPSEARPDDPPPDAAAVEFFEKEVRPILANRCVACHGPEKQKSELRLDSRAAALAGGLTGPAVEPGKPEESLLVEAIGYGEALKMPPKSKLPEGEIATLTKWVAMGAPWPGGDAGGGAAAATKVDEFDLAKRAEHWSFRPLQRVEPPEIEDRAWPITPIDRFLLARMEAEGLKPAPDADRATFLRRLTFDLIGLPPTPGEVRDFLEDRSPEAYEKVVDRLLASPHYGERWGRHWLDLVRYAETAGHEFDYDIPGAWRYRDYVVRAFNADVPYGTFVAEHLAGDLVESPRRDPVTGENESVLGTGFFVLGEGVHSPVDVREEQMRRIDNQIDVLSKAFLGLTVSCARCHDHKFDPIRQRDYYALAGFLKSSRHQHAFIDPPDRVGAKVRELAALKGEFSPTPGDEGTADRIAAYAEAAWRIAFDPASVPAEASSPSEIVFADFEGPDYGGWTPTGTAFGETPLRLPVPPYQGDVASRGRGLVGSHNGRVPGGVEDRDALTGTLTSPPFRIERDFIGFLVGGGGHAGQTCVNLLLDGRIAMSLTGRNENRMRWATFDVRPFRGREAQLEVVDRATGGWGNISLDHVVFTDDPSDPDSAERSVGAIARARGLDEDMLRHWVDAVKDPRARESGHPLAGLVSGPSARGPRDDGGSSTFEAFDGPTFGAWTTTGDAFGAGPSRPGAWRPGDSGPVPVAPGWAHSGLVSDRLQGVLRSPTFTIERPFVLYRAEGRGGRINLIIDGFEKIRAPIYGGLPLTIDADQPRWFAVDVSMWRGHRAYVEIADGAALDFTGSTSRYVSGDGSIAVDEIRFADSAAPPEEASPFSGDPADIADRARRFGAEVADALGGWRDARPDAARRDEGLGWLVARGLIPGKADPRSADLMARYRAVEATIPEPTLAPAIVDGPGEDEFLLARGNHGTPGDPVPRRFLEVLSGGDGGSAGPGPGSGRLELVRRLNDPERNPLPSRVIVNRVWHHHFGRGLVPTVDDFGHMGQPPTHPELLDYLATRFLDEGGSIKRLHRLIVLSRAYRMSSAPDPAAARVDPDNRLLHRMNVRRLEAEALRDAMLAVAGRLDPSLGGPSVAPHLTPFMDGRGRPQSSGPLDGDGRRSLYLNVRRNFLTPMLLAFDYPPPATAMGRRNVSNVPAQALTLLNDPFILDQARLWAGRLLEESGASAEDRVDRMYLTAFARLPTPAERAAALAFLGEPGRRGDRGAWADLAHVLFNVKEFLFVN